MIGNVYGRLTVVKRAPKEKNIKPKWECLCECGEITIVFGYVLRRGATESCGCLANELSSIRETTHGATRTAEWRSYHAAKNRCQNENNDAYDRYGGRGIEFRFSSFEEFFEELGFKPTTKHSVDRIENNGHYEAGNVKWSTAKEQANNRRKSNAW